MDGSPDPDDDPDLSTEIDVESTMRVRRGTPAPIDPETEQRLREQLGPDR